MHSAAAILSIGDELILGQSLDTNSQWLSQQLVARSITVAEHLTLPDDEARIAAALDKLSRAYPLVIATGGLGPTADDLTRQALSRVLGEPLEEDAATLEKLTRWLRSLGRDVSPNQRLQVMKPRGSEMLANTVGTAPGIAARRAISGTSHTCDIFCLPGPPRELHPMFERLVVPRLQPPRDRIIRTRILHTFGIGESELARRLGDLMDRSRNPLVGTTASKGEVACRLRYEGPLSPEAAETQLDETEKLIRKKVGPFIYATGDTPLEQVIVNLLREKNHALVTAESCTGGLLGAAITSISGSSDIYRGGFVTYSNEFKMQVLAVSRELLESHGAVSEQVARAMAIGAIDHAARAPRANDSREFSASHSLAITGIAGPGGDTPVKPVGTVFIARGTAAAGAPSPSTDIDVRRFHFSGDRHQVRERSVKAAIFMLHQELTGAPRLKLLWEVGLDDSPLNS